MKEPKYIKIYCGTNTNENSENEPLFLKIYTDYIDKFRINKTPLGLFMFIGISMDSTRYVNDNNFYFVFDNLAKNVLCDSLEKTERTIKKYLTTLVNIGALFPIDIKGEYIVNPYYVAKGEWKEIEPSMKHFEYISGHWECDLVTTEEKDK